MWRKPHAVPYATCCTISHMLYHKHSLHCVLLPETGKTPLTLSHYMEEDIENVPPDNECIELSNAQQNDTYVHCTTRCKCGKYRIFMRIT